MARKEKNFTFVVDGNFFLHKTLSICRKIKTKDQGDKTFGFDQKDQELLLWKLSTDLAYEIKNLSNFIDDVVYCVDSWSWRKQFSIDQKTEKYKGDREYTSDVNWDFVYDTHIKFYSILEDLGVRVTRIEGAEADDNIFMWNISLRNIYKNVIIYSGDNDLIQTVKSNHKANTIFYHKTAKVIYAHEDYERDLNNLDEWERVWKSLSIKKVVKVNPLKSSLSKIITGDKTDCVSPIYSWTKKVKHGKIQNRNITPTHVNKVWEQYTNKFGKIKHLDLFTESYQFSEILKKVVDIPYSETYIQGLFDRNRTLVYLHPNCLPDDVKRGIEEHIEEHRYENPNGIENLTKEILFEKIGYKPKEKTNI